MNITLNNIITDVQPNFKSKTIKNSNIDNSVADQHFQRAITAGATTKEEKLNAIKEWKEKGTDSKYFKKWFGDSKVVDENGKPLVVYHGSPSHNITIFDSGKSLYGEISKGFNFFTNKKSAYQNSAKDYAEFAGTDGFRRNGKVYETYLKIQKPLHIKYTSNAMTLYNGGKQYATPVEYYDTNYKEIKEKYNNGDYDGIIIENTDKNNDDSIIYLVSNPEQIKSVDNKGTFDESNPNIYFQRVTNNNNNVVDWTDKFDKVPTFEEIEKHIKDIIASGEVFDTLSPEWKIDIKGGNRVVDKITNQGNFQKLQNSAKKRHNKYVAGIKELINNSTYSHSGKNDKPKEKPNILNYHYFDVNIRIGDKTYFVRLECEENKKVPQGRYAKRSKQSHQNISNLTQKNNNVKIVHLYNIKEIKNPNIYFQRAINNNVVDLTNDFEKAPSIDEVKAYINEIVENGTKFATLSPNWFVDIKGGRRTTNKILNAGNYKKLEKMGRKRHNKYIMSLEKLLANAEYAGEKENTKKDKKPNVEKYHYFKTDVKIGNKIYQLIFDTEEYKNDNKKSTSVGYAKRNLNETEVDTNIINDNVKKFNGDTENSKSSLSANVLRSVKNLNEDTNSINDNAENINPKTVHLYNITYQQNRKICCNVRKG